MLPRRRFVGAFASRLRYSAASSFRNETGTIQTCNLLVASIWNRDRPLSGESAVVGRKRSFSSVGKEPKSQSQFVVPTVDVEALLNEFDARKTAKPSELIALLKAGERERVIKFLHNDGTRLAVERVAPGPRWGPRELYDILIKRILEIEGKDAAIIVMRKMKQSSVTPTPFSFNSLLMQVERDEGIEQPLEVLDVMQSLEVRADSVTWSILLANCLKREDRDSMVKILEYVERGSVQRWDEKVCNLLIQAYGTCYGFDRASEVLHIMMSEQVPPSVEVFKTLLRYANKDTSLEKVLRLLSIMEELQIEPDSFVQNQVARILTKHDQLRETLNVLEELEKRGQKVADTTYWVILNKCMKERNIEGLYYILDLMKASNRAPFRSFFNDLVNLFAEEGKVEELLKVLRTMEEMKVTTNARTWTCVLKGYLKIGDMRNAFSVLSMMEKNKVKPDLQFFNTLLNALALKGLGEEAKVVLKAIKQHGLKPDSMTLNALLGLYKKTGDRKGIEDVLVEAEQQEGVRLSKELLTSISSVYVDRRDMAGAMRVLKVMEANNIPLDNVALTSLLRLCAAQKDDKKAEELFIKAQHEGTSPDLVSFNWLLNVYHKAGNLQKALYTLDLLLETKVKPNKFTCIPLIKTCQDCADYKTAFTIVEVLKNQGMVIDEEVCTHLFYLCEKAGAVAGLVENLEQVMKENGIASDKLQKMIVTWKGRKSTPTTQTQQTAKKKP